MNVPLLLALGAILGGVALFGTVSAVQFSQSIAQQRAQLAAGQDAAPVDLAELPALIRAFAERNGARAGGPKTVLLLQEAEMRLDPEQAFFAIDASQSFGTRQPGFVWSASGWMMSMVPVSVVDLYVDGVGTLEARIGGAITVAHGTGEEMAIGEAMRYLAEIPFNPDAILNAPDLRWAQTGPDTIKVSLETSAGPAEVSFGFDSSGDIIEVSAPNRPRDVGGSSIPTPWIGRFSNYEQIGDYRIPRDGEVAWLLPEGEFVYWRGRMTSLDRN